MVQPDEGKRADGVGSGARPKPRNRRFRFRTRRDKSVGEQQATEQEKVEKVSGQNERSRRWKRRRRPGRSGRGNQRRVSAEEAKKQKAVPDLDQEARPGGQGASELEDRKAVSVEPDTIDASDNPADSTEDSCNVDAELSAVCVGSEQHPGYGDDQQDVAYTESEQDLECLEDHEIDDDTVEPDESGIEPDKSDVVDDSAASDESGPVLVVGVRFRKSGKIYYFSPNQLDLSQGDSVIVETARGVEFGTIVCGPKEIPVSEVVLPLKPVIRKATPEDFERAKDNEEREKQAFDICIEKIAKHELPMKLVDVEYTFDRNKLVFYFTAEGRVDFRELVKDLAAVFRTRIELRQIGVRDEAKMLGGLGCCGRSMCCASFLGEFEPVSIKMAKEQNLSLNPAKISGVCGRLMCCLRYEYEAYKACRQGLPKIGQEVRTAKGTAKVVDLDILRRLVRLDFGDGEVLTVSAEEIIGSDPKA